MPAFTTWGKWEEVRVMMKQSLLTNKVVALEENELDKLLLSEVATKMHMDSNVFISKNLHRWPTEKKQVTLESYNTCLGSIISQLTERFQLSETHKKLCLMPAIEKAHQITSELIDNLLLIGDFTFKIKNELLTETYGADFATLYPKLVGGVYVYDPELSLKIKSAVIEKTATIASKDTPTNQERLKLHATYMSEIIQQKKSDQNFEEEFKQKTGKSMAEYKEEISSKQTLTCV